MFVSEVQYLKACTPMLVTLLGIVMLFSEVQPLKARSPIDVTLLGIVMLVSEVQLLKVPFPMLITVYPSSLDGIFKSLVVPLYVFISQVLSVSEITEYSKSPLVAAKEFISANGNAVSDIIITKKVDITFFIFTFLSVN